MNDRTSDVPYLSGASEKVVFHIQVGQTGLLKVSVNSSHRNTCKPGGFAGSVEAGGNTVS